MKSDYREFVFTATGKDTDTQQLSTIDVYDNVIPEIERLHALTDLLSTAEEECAHVQGLALLLGDIAKRLRAIMECSVKHKRVGP